MGSPHRNGHYLLMKMDSRTHSGVGRTVGGSIRDFDVYCMAADGKPCAGLGGQKCPPRRNYDNAILL